MCPAARGIVLEAGCYRLLDNKETCRGPWRSLTLAGLTVAELRACHPPPTAPPAGVQGSLWPIAAAWLCLLAWHLDGSQHLALNEQHLSNQGTLRTQVTRHLTIKGERRGFSIKMVLFYFLKFISLLLILLGLPFV